MLQDIYPYIFNNSFEISGPREDDFLVLVKERRILLKNADEPVFPTVKNLKRLPEDCFYLFAVSGVKFYALPDRCEEELLAELRRMRSSQPTQGEQGTRPRRPTPMRGLLI